MQAFGGSGPALMLRFHEEPKKKRFCLIKSTIEGAFCIFSLHVRDCLGAMMYPWLAEREAMAFVER